MVYNLHSENPIRISFSNSNSNLKIWEGMFPMLDVAKKILRVPVMVYQSFIKLFSEPGFSQEDEELVNRIAKEIVEGKNFRNISEHNKDQNESYGNLQ